MLTKEKIETIKACIWKVFPDAYEIEIEPYFSIFSKPDLDIPDAYMLTWIVNGQKYEYDLESLIFSHSFAKAFWGEDIYYHFDEGSMYCDVDDTPRIYTLENIQAEDEEHLIENGNNHKGNYHWYLPAWQYHLQQMVLEEDRLKYLRSFL